MAKIKIFSKIISSNGVEKFNTDGILNDNIITYKDNTAFVNVKYSKEKVEIERTNNEFVQKLIFSSKKDFNSAYFIKSLNINVLIKTHTNSFLISKNNIYINYDLYMNGEFSDKFTYVLEWRCL